jgi:hypothetical protein
MTINRMPIRRFTEGLLPGGRRPSGDGPGHHTVVAAAIGRHLSSARTTRTADDRVDREAHLQSFGERGARPRRAGRRRSPRGGRIERAIPASRSGRSARPDAGSPPGRRRGAGYRDDDGPAALRAGASTRGSARECGAVRRTGERRRRIRRAGLVGPARPPSRAPSRGIRRRRPRPAATASRPTRRTARRPGDRPARRPRPPSGLRRSAAAPGARGPSAHAPRASRRGPARRRRLAASAGSLP